ncbi:MAG: hypothetical protein KY395_04220 [Actinobacteria bacterium]|nr:hypothetical protein [Actinomycetota bacterium]
MTVTTSTSTKSKLLGAGGEAEVFRVPGQPGVAEKRWRSPTLAQARKLELMLAHPPEGATFEGHVNLAWPTAVVRNESGAVVGFRMPAVDLDRSLPVFTAYNPDARRGQLPGITWRHLVRTARNLSSVVSALHRAGYVVGDLNESNVLVDRRALVTILDCDSIQVADPATGELHHCGVARPEFLAPELAGRDLSATSRHLASDRFSLAVMVFLLLREGVHPYAGIWKGRGEPPDLSARMRGRRFPHLLGTRLRPPPTSMGLRHLGVRIRLLFFRAFVLGPAAPWVRPTAASWESALADLEDRLGSCRRSPTHTHLRRSRCPWCARVDRGLPDPFPQADGRGVSRRPASWMARRRRAATQAIRSVARRSSSAAWNRTASARSALPPLAGIAATIVLAPLVSATVLVMALAVTLRRNRSATNTIRAVWRFLPKLIHRVRPAYWWALAATALAVELGAAPGASWPFGGS